MDRRTPDRTSADCEDPPVPNRTYRTYKGALLRVSLPRTLNRIFLYLLRRRNRSSLLQRALMLHILHRTFLYFRSCRRSARLCFVAQNAWRAVPCMRQLCCLCDTRCGSLHMLPDGVRRKGNIFRDRSRPACGIARAEREAYKKI